MMVPIQSNYSRTPVYGHLLNTGTQAPGAPHSVTDTSLYLGKGSPYIFSKFNPLNTVTPLIRTPSVPWPSVTVLTGFGSQRRGGRVLPYMGYIGMCRCEGYGRLQDIVCVVSVSNRVIARKLEREHKKRSQLFSTNSLGNAQLRRVSRIGYINQSVWVQNRVSFFRETDQLLKILSRLSIVV